MLAGIACAVVLGALVGVATLTQREARIADDPRLALTVTISGAVAGWALIDGVLRIEPGQLGFSDATGALAGAVMLGAAAWRSRRKTLREHREARARPDRPRGLTARD